MWSQAPSEGRRSRKRVPATTSRLFAERFEPRIRIVPDRNCVKRPEHLEASAREQPFVDKGHAIQAGREIRVILNAKKANDTAAY